MVLLKYSIPDSSWLLGSILSPSQESGIIKIQILLQKSIILHGLFSHFLYHVLTALRNQVREQCRTKVDKSQLYIPHQKPVEYLVFSSTLTILIKKSFFFILSYFVHQCSTISDIVSSKYFHFLGTCLETNLHTRLLTRWPELKVYE